MFDFGALPPEVNSTRLYAGPGADSLAAAASGWQALASQLESVGQGYVTVISELQGQSWAGGASAAMAAAAQPYVAWLEATAATAEESAGQARTAAAAYEQAYAATVPPALVEDNREMYTALVAANVFGHYSTQIAMVEAEYADMWAQDAQAMYSYAASSSVATSLTPFADPPQTTSTTAQTAQSSAVAQAAATSSTSNSSALSQLMNSTPQQLQSLAAAGSSTSSASTSTDGATLLTTFSDLNTLSSPTNLGAGFARTFFGGGSFLTGVQRSLIQAKDLPKIAAEDAARAGGAAAKADATAAISGLGREPVLAGFGRSAPVGGLSALQSWAHAAPIASAFEEPHWLSEADLHAVPAAAGSTPGSAPVMGMSPKSNPWGRTTVNNVLRVPSRGFKMPRPALGG